MHPLSQHEKIEKTIIFIEVTNILNLSHLLELSKTFRKAAYGDTFKKPKRQKHFIGNSDFTYLKLNIH